MSLKKLRIALVTPDIARASTGMTSFVVSLAERLCGAGAEVSVITADLGYRGGRSGESAQIDQRAKVHAFQVRSFIDRRLYRSSEMRYWLAQNISGFDVVHIQGVWSFVASDAAKVCARAGVPYIITPHGQTGKEDWQKAPLKKAVFSNLLLRGVWERAAAIHFLSLGEMENSVIQAKDHSVRIPIAIALPENVHEPRGSYLFRKRFAIPAKSLVILFLGRFTSQKGVLEIVDAFDLAWQRHKEAVLVLAGPLDGSYARAVVEKTRCLGSRSAIRLIGPTFGEDKNAAFSTASVFITLSRNEGLPIAALEALSHGVPVILTAQSNIPEIADYGAGMIVRRDATEAAEALELMLRNRALALEMGKNARKLAREQFSWKTILPQVLALYERVARSSRSDSETKELPFRQSDP